MMGTFLSSFDTAGTFLLTNVVCGLDSVPTLVEVWVLAFPSVGKKVSAVSPQYYEHPLLAGVIGPRIRIPWFPLAKEKQWNQRMLGAKTHQIRAEP
jgi:hypothetical protein